MYINISWCWCNQHGVIYKISKILCIAVGRVTAFQGYQVRKPRFLFFLSIYLTCKSKNKLSSWKAALSRSFCQISVIVAWKPVFKDSHGLQSTCSTRTVIFVFPPCNCWNVCRTVMAISCNAVYKVVSSVHIIRSKKCRAVCHQPNNGNIYKLYTLMTHKKNEGKNLRRNYTDFLHQHLHNCICEKSLIWLQMELR